MANSYSRGLKKNKKEQETEIRSAVVGTGIITALGRGLKEMMGSYVNGCSDQVFQAGGTAHAKALG